MGKIGDTLIKGITTEEIVKDLKALYTIEEINAYAVKVASSKIGGRAEIMLESRVATLGVKFNEFSSKIAERVTVLRGELPEELSCMKELSPVVLEPLPSPNNMSEFLKALLERFRSVMPVYVQLIEKVKDKDPFTYFMLLSILEYYVIHEEELETGGWF